MNADITSHEIDPKYSVAFKSLNCDTGVFLINNKQIQYNNIIESYYFEANGITNDIIPNGAIDTETKSKIKLMLNDR